MLATKGTDREYLRMRRTYLLDCIKRPKFIEQINRFYVESKNLDNVSFQTIKDDIENLKRIGLKITYNSNRYHLKRANCIIRNSKLYNKFDKT